MPADDIDPIRDQLIQQAHAAIEGIEPFFEMLDGMVAATVRRGWTDEQARAIVVHLLTGGRAAPQTS